MSYAIQIDLSALQKSFHQDPENITAIISAAGTFLGGIGNFALASAAFVTIIIINRRSQQMQWEDGFRNLFREFWDDDQVKLARALIQ